MAAMFTGYKNISEHTDLQQVSPQVYSTEELFYCSAQVTGMLDICCGCGAGDGALWNVS